MLTFFNTFKHSGTNNRNRISSRHYIYYHLQTVSPLLGKNNNISPENVDLLCLDLETFSIFFCMWFIVLKDVDQNKINGEERRKRSRSKTSGGKCNDGRDRCNETKTPEKNETIILRMLQ